MRKSVFSVLICFAVIFSLCACSAEKEFIMGEFCRNVSFNMDEVTVKGELNFRSEDDITFKVTEPDNLEGIIFTENQIKKDEITIKYEKLKDESPVFIFLSVVKNIAESQIYLPLEGEFAVTGAVPSAEYKVVFDCEKEEILTLQAGKFTYNFE